MKTTKRNIFVGTVLQSVVLACGANPGTDDSTESHWLEGIAKTRAGSEPSSNEASEGVEPTDDSTNSAIARPSTTPDVVPAAELPATLSDTPNAAKSIEDMDPFWIRQWGGVHTERVDELGTDSAGNVVVVGHVEVGTDDEGAENRAQYIVKLDANGEELWRIQTPDRRSFDVPQNLAVNSQGHAFVAVSVDNEDADPSVTRYDADGNVVWTSTWGAAASEYLFDVALDSHDNVFVVGKLREEDAGLTKSFVTKLDSDGNLSWTQTFDALKDENATEIAVDARGNIATSTIVGYRVGAIDSVVRKLDSAGKLLWEQTWDGPEDTFIFGLLTNERGEVFIAGSQERDDESVGFLAKLDCRGTVQWFQSAPSWGLDVVTSLAFGQDGLVTASMGWGSGRMALTEFDTNGTLIWSETFGTAETDRVYSLAVTPDQIVVAGETYGALKGVNAGESDSFVLALDPQR